MGCARLDGSFFGDGLVFECLGQERRKKKSHPLNTTRNKANDGRTKRPTLSPILGA